MRLSEMNKINAQIDELLKFAEEDVEKRPEEEKKKGEKDLSEEESKEEPKEDKEISAEESTDDEEDKKFSEKFEEHSQELVGRLDKLEKDHEDLRQGHEAILSRLDSLKDALSKGK